MKIKISLAVTTHNEGHYISDLLGKLTSFVDRVSKVDPTEYEIVVLDDFSTDPVSLSALANFQSSIRLEQRSLQHNFASQKNYLNSICSGDWILQLDADEFVTDDLLYNLSSIIEANPEIEAFWLPRINIVDGLTLEHVRKWSWIITDNDEFISLRDMSILSPEYELLDKYKLIISEEPMVDAPPEMRVITFKQPIVCWPDYQMRLYKNTPRIYWERVVHERLTGFGNKFAILPQEVDFAIRHFKEISRQEKQNAYYDSL